LNGPRLLLLMFFDASVEFIVTTLGLVSDASCSSVLEASDRNVADALPTQASSMAEHEDCTSNDSHFRLRL